MKLTCDRDTFLECVVFDYRPKTTSGFPTKLSTLSM